jgi:predicted RNase H-like HicB family nuclease
LYSEAVEFGAIASFILTELPEPGNTIGSVLQDGTMQYQLFVQSLTTQNEAEQKFVASVVEMPAVSGEGATEAEAIAQAKAALESRLATGKFVTIQITSANQDHSANQKTDPWLKHLGLFANDSTFEDFLEEVAIHRQQVDEEAEA